MDNLTRSTFAENLNTSFQLRLDETKTVELVLLEVSNLRVSERSEAFSLLFRGPADHMVAQAVYPVEHARMGLFDVFIVPVGVTEEGFQYEAVFNRLKETTT
jgi:hypothetical protein